MSRVTPSSGAKPAARLAHAHVEGALDAEGEAARGLVELHRRDANVEGRTIETRQAKARSHRHAGGELRMFEHEAAVICFDKRLPRRNGVGIAVEGQHAGARCFQYRLRITASTKCSVEIKAALAHIERVEHLFQEHGNVPGRSACGLRSLNAAALCHSRAP